MDEERQGTATLLREEAKTSCTESYAENYNSLGHLFTQAREFHKMSIEDVAKNLCLTEDKIKAIETNQLQNFDAPIYARGYVDAYAKLVGIPKNIWEPLISKLGFQVAPKVCAPRSNPVQIKKSIAQMNHSMLSTRDNKKNQKALWFSAALLVVVFVAVSWWSMGSSNHSEGVQSSTQEIPIQLKQGS